MPRHLVRSTGEALAFITDCTLATVARLAARSTPQKEELQRQCAIAQAGIGWMDEFGIDYSSTRAAQVKVAGGKVEVWAAQFREPGSQV